MFDPTLRADAERLLARLRAEALMIVTAESCTGGLISALLTDIPGSSSVVERGYVTYSNKAKMDCLGVPRELIEKHGAVSAEVARAMAAGALMHSNADIAIAVTGIAGPGGDTPDKPVGLVYVGLSRTDAPTFHLRLTLGDIGRSNVRMETLRHALVMINDALSPAEGGSTGLLN